MPRVIGVLSGKGGVGKTTLVSNLGYALTQLGHNVTLIDGNVTTPHLGMHLGMHMAPKTIHHVLKGETSLKSATYDHPLGFKVIPGSLSVNDLIGLDIGELANITKKVNTDFVLVDSAPALGREAASALAAVSEVVLIANPDLPSIADALKTAKVAEASGKKVLGVVLNRMTRKRHEVGRNDVHALIQYPVIAEIPEDENVAASIASKTPLLDMDPSSPASQEFFRLACKLTGRQMKRNLTFMEKMISWLTG
ncbi:septum site-determining protein MinD [archaeon]|nr:MAG: septum site-determining protein MinD [archaeon]